MMASIIDKSGAAARPGAGPPRGGVGLVSIVFPRMTALTHVRVDQKSTAAENVTPWLSKKRCDLAVLLSIPICHQNSYT